MTDVAVSTDSLVRRHAQAVVEIALTDTRVVLINGARQAGKSTLIRLVTAGRDDVDLERLDDPPTLEAARYDPVGFVGHDGLLAIDEVQRAPELLLPIKDQVDTDPRPGRYLLTGSARVLGLRSLPDALPGRMETIELWPFSQGEIEGVPDGFAEKIFNLAEGPLPAIPAITKLDLAQRLVRGGFPTAVQRTNRQRRTRFFTSYVNDIIDRDIQELSEIEQAGDLRRLLQLVAARTGQLLVSSTLADELRVSARTVRRYLELCEEVFLIKRIPAWSSNLAKRAISTPKVAFVDSGVAAYLLGQDDRKLGGVRGHFGPLLEGFVVMELARQLSWAAEEIRLFHYRTKDQIEVDAVLETMDGRVAGVEVKASASVGAADFRGLESLQHTAGESFAAGVLLYAGAKPLSFGPRLKALPMSALWTL